MNRPMNGIWQDIGNVLNPGKGEPNFKIDVALTPLSLVAITGIGIGLIILNKIVNK